MLFSQPHESVSQVAVTQQCNALLGTKKKAKMVHSFISQTAAVLLLITLLYSAKETHDICAIATS
jgi:hypothetical protein